MKKLMLIFLFLIAISLSITGCGGSNGVSDESLINTLVDQFVSGWLNSDSDMISSCVDYPFAIVLPTVGSHLYTSQTELKNALDTFFASYDYTTCSITNRSIVVSGSTASMTALQTYTLTATPPATGHSVTNVPTSLNFIKRGDGWKIYAP